MFLFFWLQISLSRELNRGTPVKSDNLTLERLVAPQLVTYICLLPSTQSGFRRGYFTETAITRVLSDLLDAVDRDDTVMLV